MPFFVKFFSKLVIGASFFSTDILAASVLAGSDETTEHEP